MTMKIRLKLLSDATFGRGDGVAGLVDAEIEHDEYGMPYLRGRTLKGLLLEEATHILFALVKAGRGSRWEAAAQQLFGTSGGLLHTGESILHIGDAHLPEDLREVIIADVTAGYYTSAEVLEALTTIRAQTAMEPSGVPAKGSLRATRVLLRGTVLEAEVHTRRPLSDEEQAFLAACVKALRRAGTGRNRGRGRLEATLWQDGESITDRAFTYFEQEVLQ